MKGPLIKRDDYLADLLNALFLRSSFRDVGTDDEEPLGGIDQHPQGPEGGSGGESSPAGPDAREITEEEAALLAAAILLEEAHARTVKKQEALRKISRNLPKPLP